jgi:hypothetical protein
MNPVTFGEDEMLAIVEDLARVPDELHGSGDEVNAWLLDQVVSRLLERTIWGR